MGLPHETTPIHVWVDVDLGIRDFVVFLNTIPGVRTIASCQGTIGEGGPHPYPAEVMASWTDESLPFLQEFAREEVGACWGYIYPGEAGNHGPHMVAWNAEALVTPCEGEE